MAILSSSDGSRGCLWRRGKQTLPFLVYFLVFAHIFLTGALAAADHRDGETSSGLEWMGSNDDEGIEVTFTNLVPRIYTPLEGSSPTYISGQVTYRWIPRNPIKLRLSMHCASAERRMEETLVQTWFVLVDLATAWDCLLDLHEFGPCRDARLQISPAASNTKVLAMGHIAVHQLVAYEMAWADHRRDQRLSPLDLEEARALANVIAPEFAGTAAIQFDKIVMASVNKQGSDLRMYWITVECDKRSDQGVCPTGSLFLFGIHEMIVNGAVQHEVMESRPLPGWNVLVGQVMVLG